ncbi:hypothetical protein BGX34_000955, partial [Mortierella sp. NVP85]
MIDSKHHVTLVDAETLMQELEANANLQQRIFIQTCREKNLTTYPLKAALPSLASPSLLDRVQNKPDAEGTLRQLRKQRLKEQGNAVYIQPQAKSSLKSPDDQRFSLLEKVEEFLDSDQKVFLLLGDSGAGKSTFNRHLECELWNKYKKNTGRIPLFINLPAIDKPEQDMIAKHLRKAEFTEPEIRELKVNRKFILICDGYDESQQTHNLYVSNRLNQPGEWTAQMVVGCRSEYLGVDYRDRFQPGDRNSRPEPGQFQEAVITSFTPDQIQDYIKQYVSVRQPLWKAEDYERALDLIPGLKELVRNPFLMTLSLEVLPRMVDPGEHLSVTHITRVALYDQFIEHWLERGKKQISEMNLSSQAKAAFESLTDEGFTQNGVDFLKKLSVAIYREQDGHPIVKYSRFKDEESWKTAFFSRNEEKQLLRKTSPLTRDGNQYRFIHRSLLEYGLALSVFDPNDWKEKHLPMTLSGRRGSTSSAYSFHIHGSTTDAMAHAEQGPDINSPLAWRYFVNEPSVLQFLNERVQQEPVFKQQLLDYIEHSKTDKKWRTAAANAITILVRAGVQFIKQDLRGVQIPGADLSNGVLESAQLQDADLRQVNLRGAWLYKADLSRAQMGGVQFGERPFLVEDGYVLSCAYSPNGKSLAFSHSGEQSEGPSPHPPSRRGLNASIRVYSTSSWELVRTLTGHMNGVNCIAYSPTGDRIVSGSKDYTARLWNAEAGTCIHILKGHRDHVNSVAFSPRGDTVASASTDRTVRVWDVGTGECRFTLTHHNKGLASVVYSPKGDRVASGEWIATGPGDQQYAVLVWDVDTGKSLHTLSGHSDSIRGVAYSPRGDRIASGSRDTTIRIWDAETGTCCRNLTDHDGGVYSVAFSLQGDLIASASADKTVRIWDAELGTCHQIFTGHSRSVRCVVFSPNGDRIASGSEDKTVRLWDVGSGGTRQLAIGHRQKVLSVVFSPNGDQVVSCGHDGSIRLRDAESGVCLRTIASCLYEIASVAYSPQGDLVVSGLKCKETVTEGARTGVGFHDANVYVPPNQVSYTSSATAAPGISDPGHVQPWDPRDATVYVPAFKTTSASSEDPCHVRLWDPPDATVNVPSFKTKNPASTSAVGTMEPRDITSFVSPPQRNQANSHTAPSTVVAYSLGGTQVASGDSDRAIRMDDVKTKEYCYALEHHVEKVVGIMISSKRIYIASDYFGRVNIRDIETGVCIHKLDGHNGRAMGIGYSSRGNLLASAGHDSTVRLWDAQTGERRQVLTGHTNRVWIVVFSPQGDQVASGSEDGAVKIWEATTGKCLYTLTGHTKKVICAVYSPRGDQIVSGSLDKTIRLWSLASGQCRAVVQDLTSYVESIAWSTTTDANCFVAGCEDGSVWMGQVVEGDACHIRWRWRSVSGELNLDGTLIQGVHGLSQVNKQLLEQRGATGVPSVRLRKVIRRVATMLPTVRPTYAMPEPHPVDAWRRPTPYPLPAPLPEPPEPIMPGMIIRPPPRGDPYLPFGGYPAMIDVGPPTQQEGKAALEEPDQRPY